MSANSGKPDFLENLLRGSQRPENIALTDLLRFSVAPPMLAKCIDANKHIYDISYGSVNHHDVSAMKLDYWPKHIITLYQNLDYMQLHTDKKRQEVEEFAIGEQVNFLQSAFDKYGVKMRTQMANDPPVLLIIPTNAEADEKTPLILGDLLDRYEHLNAKPPASIANSR